MGVKGLYTIPSEYNGEHVHIMQCIPSCKDFLEKYSFHFAMALSSYNIIIFLLIGIETTLIHRYSEIFSSQINSTSNHK